MALVAATQVEFWKKYISFERSNPLRSEDTALVTKRVMFATEQCLLVLTHHPAVWHQAAQYLDQSSKNFTEKGVRIKISLLNPSDLCFRRLVCLANFYPAPLKSMGGQWPCAMIRLMGTINAVPCPLNHRFANGFHLSPKAV